MKELEKYGFELNDIGLNESYLIYKKYIKPYISIDIYLDNREVCKNNDGNSGMVKEEDICDLIKADLVIKE